MKPTDHNPYLSDALLCAAAHELAETAGPVMMYMPGGMQTITPFAGGIGSPIEVMVDASGAAALNQQLTALAAKGKKPYFDFEHEDAGASFWPNEFFWSETPKPGIYARGEWTADGKSGVEGKRWRQFSPVFHVDNKAAKPARIVCKTDAKPNMGGLVNDPAFSNILPLWAKNATGAESGNQQHNTQMNEQEVQQLRDRIKELETEIATLKSKGQADEVTTARLEAKEAQLKLAKAELENSELKAKNAKADTEIQTQRKANAKAAVAAAVERGVIAAKDETTIKAWEDDIIADPARAGLLAKMGGNPAVNAPRITGSTPAPGSATISVGVSAKDAVKAYGELVCKNKDIKLSAATAEEKNRLADEAAGIFARDLANVDLAGAILAADSTSDNLGVLTGALAMQAALPNMLRKNPLVNSITTDFSGEPGLFNRTDNTRVILRPAVQTYDATADSAGRPKGWVTVSDARAIDVPVTLDQYFAVPIVFGISTLASTGRKLFDEQSPQAISAMGGYLTDLIKALFTAANYNAYKGTSLAAGATTNGSKTVTCTSTANAFVGAEISGTGIPSGTFIKAVVDATTLTLSKAATATGSGLTLTLSAQGDLPTAYTTYVKALASFAVADMDTIAAALDSYNVPDDGRFAALAPAYYRKLGSDSAVNALMQGTGDASYLTERKLPKMSGFEMLNSPWFPTSSNRTGFAGHKAAAVVKTRLPQDLTQAIPGTSVPGSVATVNDPSTGISLALVSYYNLQAGYAEWRPELMAGVAVGDRRAGLVLTSA